MKEELCLYICQLYLPEVRHILKKGAYPDVRLMAYPYDCLSSPFGQSKFRKMQANCAKADKDALIIGASCLNTDPQQLPSTNKIKIHNLDFCSEILLNKELIAHFIQKKYYLITEGWLLDHRRYIQDWGFEPEMAKKFFAESAEKILLLETGITENYLPDLVSVSDYMGLPYEILPIGLSHCKQLIENLIYQWRAEKERIAMNDQISIISRKVADSSMIFELLQKLTDLTDSEDIVKKIFDIIFLLFAPETISYQRQNHPEGDRIFYFQDKTHDPTTPPDQSLVIEARNQGEVLGWFTLNNLKFPEFKTQYESHRRVIGGFAGLALANSRKFLIIKRNEKQLLQFTEELKLANANKDKFFSIIAHDLRSPFNALLGLTELMVDQENPLGLDEMQKMAFVVRNASLGLFNQMENLLQWSRIQMSAITIIAEPLKIINLVRDEAEAIHGFLVKKNIQLSMDVDPDLSITTDRNMLQSILRNLITNAVKFSYKDSSIWLSAKRLNEKQIEFRVKDEGIGMNSTQLSDLFDIGKQISRKGTQGEPSSGLGLVLCQEFVTQLGGSIWAESIEGKGSTFIFTIAELNPTEHLLP